MSLVSWYKFRCLLEDPLEGRYLLGNLKVIQSNPILELRFLAAIAIAAEALSGRSHTTEH